MSFFRNESGELRSPFNVFWNSTEGRIRAFFRLIIGFVLLFILAAVGNQFRSTFLPGEGPLIQTVNMIAYQIPNALGILTASLIAAKVLDRRSIRELGLNIQRQWWGNLGKGFFIGSSITAFSILIGLYTGFYQFEGLNPSLGLLWPVFLLGGVVFQLLYVFPEELFVRGYVITNILEGFEGISQASKLLAGGVAVAVSSLIFYYFHSMAKGFEFGVLVAGLSVLLGITYILSGDLSLPLGIHLGYNMAGVILGTNIQPASILRLSSTTSIDESTALPMEAMIVRMLGAAIAVILILWIYWDGEIPDVV